MLAGADRIGQPAHDRERRALSRERERERRRPSRRERSRERDLSLRANRRASLKHADGNNQRKEQNKTNHQPATLAARRSDVVDPTSGAQQRHARRVPIRTSRAPTHSPSGACVPTGRAKGRSDRASRCCLRSRSRLQLRLRRLHASRLQESGRVCGLEAVHSALLGACAVRRATAAAFVQRAATQRSSIVI